MTEPIRIHVYYGLESPPFEVRFVSEISGDGVQVFRGANLSELVQTLSHAHANLLGHLYEIRRDRKAPRNSLL